MHIKPYNVYKPPTAPQSNPTDSQRHEMIREALINKGRPEDFEYIIKYLGPPPDITTYAAPGQYKGIKVAVVGAGIAGLAVAFELRKLGFDITIIEAEEQRIGGRIYTHYFDNEKKLYGELGASRVPASHETVWHYINLFNLNTTRLTRGKADTFVYVRGIRARNNSKEIMEKIYPQFDLTPSERITPWPQLYEQVLEAAIKSLSPEVKAEGLQLRPHYDPQGVSVAGDMTLRQVLKAAGLSDGAIALITSLNPEVNAFIEGYAYTELVTQYGLFMRNTYRIDGGMTNLPLAFYRSLSSENPQEYSIPQNAIGKVTFKMGSWVARCYKSDKDRKVILEYLSKQMPKGAFEAFDYVFFTVPLTALRKMYLSPPFSSIMMEAIRELNYVDAQKTLFLCNERFWEKQGITGGRTITDLIIQMIMYPSDRLQCGQNTQDISPDCSLNEPDVLTASYNIGNDAMRLGNTETFRFELIKRQIERIHGLPDNYLDKVVTDHITFDWNRNERITGAFVNLLPGQGERFLYQMFRPEYDNRVYFAGEAYSAPHGWIQAALRSAKMAADALAYYLKTHGHRQGKE